jgi:hypothetical protein
MKKLLLGMLLLVSLSSAFAGDGKYYSRIIHDSDAAMQVTVPSGLYMKITTFTQSGGFGGNQIGGVTVYRGASGGPDGATVLLANSAPTGASSEGVIVAGPTTVYVAPIPNATLFISFLLGRN